ncbi:hypothetical protein [Desertibacillus haloalkaliphilus]|uniref:hypothetical protein n=1 Tax=Desertibacillus haloalkaliphilus TaxID=1328930 RepID=UPI001C25FBBF|nr:hypothetical protein [Desertibacillus haloalkaliphilus]MBU8908089.1 hypothetical protein [Desertibacillus haloalkaliphilus]
MEVQVKKRKVRSDKKKDVKPTIPEELYECIARLSYITQTPIKDVAETICIQGVQSKKVVEYLSNGFKRDFWMGQTLFKGDRDIEPSRIIRVKGNKRRITIRFKRDVHDQLCDLAYAMDLTVSSATGKLLDAAVRNTDIVHEYIEQYINETFDHQRQKQLKVVLDYINKHNPYDEEVSLMHLINMIAEDFFSSKTNNIKKSINEFLDRFIK